MVLRVFRCESRYFVNFLCRVSLLLDIWMQYRDYLVKVQWKRSLDTQKLRSKLCLSWDVTLERRRMSPKTPTWTWTNAPATKTKATSLVPCLRRHYWIRKKEPFPWKFMFSLIYHKSSHSCVSWILTYSMDSAALYTICWMLEQELKVCLCKTTEKYSFSWRFFVGPMAFTLRAACASSA